jgi:hypothetical protein
LTVELSTVAAYLTRWIMLPHVDRAVVDLRKLREYVLSAENERGRHKARVFSRVLGLGPDDSEWLRGRILDGVRHAEAVRTDATAYGTLYRVDVTVETERGAATVRTGWIVRHDEAFPRLTTCFVL